MGVFDIPKGDDNILVIHNPEWDENEKCRARKTVLVADREWVENQQLQIKKTGNRKQRRSGGFQQQDDVDIETQLGASDRLWVFRMLIDWTFTKDNMSMPLTLKAVQELPDAALNYIYDAIMEVQPQRNKKESEKEGENPTMKPVSLSIVGVSSKADEEWSDETGPRNFLSRS